MTLLGKRIRRARTEKGLSLAKLSQLTGISLSTIQAVEVGTIELPSKSILRSIGAALEPLESPETLALAAYSEAAPA